MNLSSILEPKISRARAWLSTMQEQGCYRAWIAVDPPAPADDPDKPAVEVEPPPFTLGATGAAAHLHAWLFAVYGEDADRWACRAACDCMAALLAEGTLAAGFFELGIGARGAYAASKALNRPEYWDLSIMLGASMRGCDSTDGPHNRKAATIFKLLKRIADYDDLDYSYFAVAPMPDRAARGEANGFADQLHSLACSCEALVTSDASVHRGRREFDLLRSRLQKSDVVRGDVIAQYIRLTVAQGSAPAMADLDRLFDFQHSSGGFYERLSRNPRGKCERLSLLATVVAIQAMVMAQNLERAKLPGPLTRKELALV